MVRVYHRKKGLHIVVMYLVVGNWRFPWSFRVYRGKDTPSPSKLAQKLLNTLPSILVKRFKLLVLGDTAFGGMVKARWKERNSLCDLNKADERLYDRPLGKTKMAD